MGQTWPAVEIDAVMRLRVLTAAVLAPMYAEDTIEAPFDQVWSVASDLEVELPRMVRPMRSFTIVGRESDALRAEAVSVLGHRADFDVVLRPGWCLMQSRYIIGGMAAVPDGAHTRFAVLGGSRLLKGNLPQRALGPVGRRLGGTMISRLRRQLAA